jgi:hypothetical protein
MPEEQNVMDEVVPRTEETQVEHEITETPEAETPETTQDSETEIEAQEKKGKGGFSKKIDKLTARNYQLEKARAEDRQWFADQVAELKRQLAGEKPAVKAETSSKPSPDKFQTYEDYVEALAEWKTEQKVTEREQAARQEKEQEQTKATFAAYNRRVSEARGKFEDFDEVVGNDDVTVPPSAQLAIVELENGPEVAYYLGKHPEEAEALHDMSDRKVIMTIGRISDSLDSKSSPAPRRPASGAPAPYKPVGTSSTKSTQSLEEMPQRQYNELMNKRERERSGR